MHRRTALITLVTAGLVVLACLPAVVTFGLGWLPLPNIQPWGAPPARDTSSLEAWTLFAVIYLAWMVGLIVLLIWSFDRIGHKWRYHESTPRPKKDRRRARASMQAVNAEQQANMQAMRRREAREAQRRRSRESHDARNDGSR